MSVSIILPDFPKEIKKIKFTSNSTAYSRKDWKEAKSSFYPWITHIAESFNFSCDFSLVGRGREVNDKR